MRQPLFLLYIVNNNNINKETELSTQQFIYLHKYTKTRPYTDGFQKNNAKCLKSNEICSFVPYSSIDGF